MIYLLSQFMASENWIVREEAKIVVTLLVFKIAWRDNKLYTPPSPRRGFTRTSSLTRVSPPASSEYGLAKKSWRNFLAKEESLRYFLSSKKCRWIKGTWRESPRKKSLLGWTATYFPEFINYCEIRDHEYIPRELLGLLGFQNGVNPRRGWSFHYCVMLFLH